MDDIREQIEQLRNVAVLTEIKATQMFEEAADTMEKLLAVYEAAKVCMSCNEYTHNGERASVIFGGVTLLDALDAVQTTESVRPGDLLK